MSKEERKRLEDRFHALSFVCWCGHGRVCSACREQGEITKRLKEGT
jgi:hypothetical protein